MQIWTKASLLALVAGAATASTAMAIPAFALTDENVIVGFDTASPTVFTSAHALKTAGGQPIQDLIGIDFRPATGVLYGVGKQGAVYTIDPLTGVAETDTNLSVSPAGSRFGFDFNPVPDRLRLISDTDQNLRINVDTGAAMVDGTVNYPAGGNPNLVAAAYTNNIPGATTTTLYAIDAVTDQLYVSTNPNAGIYTAVGSLGALVNSINGFDIVTIGGTDYAFAALTESATSASKLYSINLLTGLATPIDVIGGGDFIDGLAIAPIPEPTALAALAGLGIVAVRRSRR